MLLRKHPGQIDDTVIQNIHAQLVADLTEICRFIITICQNKDLDTFVVRVHDPVFPDTGLLMEVELCESVMPMSPGGKDLHHPIGRAPEPDVILLKRADGKGNTEDPTRFWGCMLAG